jgi:hypothetical protein
MGIDPARKTDNFSISILKLMPNKTYRDVYCFSMNKKSWPVAVRKVRDLINNFNIVRIAMDAGGGGTTVADLLQDDAHKEPGEHLIWEFNNDEHMRFKGLHILEMVNFSPGWIGQANYGLAADIENRILLFPYRTSTANNTMDFEDIWEEIDEQKKETCMIVVTSTKTGVQHFDLPEMASSQQGTLKVHRRKDRYSALLLSTYAARTFWSETKKSIAMPSIGGWVDQL